MSKAIKVKIALEDGAVLKGFSFGSSEEIRKDATFNPYLFFKKSLTFFRKLVSFIKIFLRDDKGVLIYYKEVEGTPFLFLG